MPFNLQINVLRIIDKIEYGNILCKTLLDFVYKNVFFTVNKCPLKNEGSIFFSRDSSSKVIWPFRIRVKSQNCVNFNGNFMSTKGLKIIKRYSLFINFCAEFQFISYNISSASYITNRFFLIFFIFQPKVLKLK